MTDRQIQLLESIYDALKHFNDSMNPHHSSPMLVELKELIVHERCKPIRTLMNE